MKFAIKHLAILTVFLYRYITKLYNESPKVFHSIYLSKYRNQRWSLYDSRNVRVCAGH